METKIATITGDTARLISKAQVDTGILIFKDASYAGLKVIDVYIEIENFLTELIKEWSENKERFKTII